MNVLFVCLYSESHTTKSTENSHGCNTNNPYSTDTLFNTEEFVPIGNWKRIPQFPEHVQIKKPADQGQK